MTPTVLVREAVAIRVGERIGRLLDEEVLLAKMAGRNEKGSILAGTITALVSLIDAGGPYRPGALAELERAARACLMELVSVSDAIERDT